MRTALIVITGQCIIYKRWYNSLSFHSIVDNTYCHDRLHNFHNYYHTTACLYLDNRYTVQYHHILCMDSILVQAVVAVMERYC